MMKEVNEAKIAASLCEKELRNNLKNMSKMKFLYNPTTVEDCQDGLQLMTSLIWNPGPTSRNSLLWVPWTIC